jgi:hypothetical protein
MRIRRPPASRRTVIARIGRLEVAVRVRPARSCGACAGRGWFHTKGTLNPRPAPAGYDGVSLCGCASALDRLSDSRRFMRDWDRRARREPPF